MLNVYGYESSHSCLTLSGNYVNVYCGIKRNDFKVLLFVLMLYFSRLYIVHFLIIVYFHISVYFILLYILISGRKSSRHSGSQVLLLRAEPQEMSGESSAGPSSHRVVDHHLHNSNKNCTLI